jgi:hypothetical protein
MAVPTTPTLIVHGGSGYGFRALQWPVFLHTPAPFDESRNCRTSGRSALLFNFLIAKEGIENGKRSGRPPGRLDRFVGESPLFKPIGSGHRVWRVRK